MSYCVHCGVELDKSLEACPLCGTVVMDPASPENSRVKPAYSPRVDYIMRRVERRYIALVISVVMMLAIGVCLVADALYSPSVDWSWFVMFSLMLAWVLFVVPIAMRLPAEIYVLFDTVAAAAFLYAVSLVTDGAQWYTQLALPLTLLLSFIVIVNVELFKHRMFRALEQWGCAWISVGAGIVGVEMVLDLNMHGAVELQWSYFVLAPCLAIGIILFILSHRSRLKDEVARRLHIT